MRIHFFKVTIHFNKNFKIVLDDNFILNDVIKIVDYLDPDRNWLYYIGKGLTRSALSKAISILSNGYIPSAISSMLAWGHLLYDRDKIPGGINQQD